MRLIAISGKRGAGKDTAARIIREVLAPGLSWQSIAFADKMKESAAVILGVPLEMLYTQSGKATYLPDWGMTIGEFLQQFGEGVCQINPRAWALPVQKRLKPYGDYLVTDVRKPVELDVVRECGGVIIRIEGNPAGMQGDGTRDESHYSETALDGYDFDVVIDNNSDLAALTEKLHCYLSNAGIL